MKDFFKDLAERAIKTFFQSVSASLIGVVIIDPIEWQHAFIVALIAAFISVCTSMASFKFGEEGTASILEYTVSHHEHESDNKI